MDTINEELLKELKERNLAAMERLLQPCKTKLAEYGETSMEKRYKEILSKEEEVLKRLEKYI